MASLTIELLARKHRPLLKGFQNQHASLVEYIRRFALRHLERDRLTRTYLAIHCEGQVNRVAGYFSLAAVSVERASLGSIPALSRLPQFPIPGVLLARLAVDERVQGQGIGKYLFEEAIRLTINLARSGPIGFRLFVTDAIDPDAARFYERFGLSRLSEEYPVRMVLDLNPMLGVD